MYKIIAASIVAAIGLVGSAASAYATQDQPHKVFVCKYVGTPFVDERLQTGQNPISVDVSAIPQWPVDVGSYFADQHGRSYVLAFDEGQDEPDVSECPAASEPTTTTRPDETTTTTERETTTTAPPTSAPCTEPRGCPPPPQPTNPDGSFRLGGPDGPDGELPETGSSSLALFALGSALLAVGLAARSRSWRRSAT